MLPKKVDWLDDFGLLVIRSMLGFVFLFHGSQKLFGVLGGAGLAGFARYLAGIDIPLPAHVAVLAGGAEFLGGLALVSGYGLRAMVLPLVGTMGAAAYLAHQHTFSVQEGGFEYPLSLGVVLLGLALTGPGKWTVVPLGAVVRRLLPRTAVKAPEPVSQPAVVAREQLIVE